MKKIVLLSVGLVLLTGIIAAVVYWELRPQVITSKDGTKLTLVGVTYGRHHMLKGFKPDRRFGNGRSTLDTTNDTLVVWIETNQKGEAYQLFVYDPSNTACVGEWPVMIGRMKVGTVVEAFKLNAFPRRDRKMILRIGSAKGQFVISNPGPRSFLEWQPDPMPDTQSDGDLGVTLTKCVAGTPHFYSAVEYVPSNDPMHKGVLVAFHTVQNGNVVTNWDPVDIETSDATGNLPRLRHWEFSRDASHDVQMTYQWGLWPGEAWKLRVEMSRASGFTDAETWGVTNVPVHKGVYGDLWNYQTNSAFAGGTINGHHICILPIIRITDESWRRGNPAGFRVAIDPDIPTGYRLTLLATDERGRNIQCWGPTPNGVGYYVFQSENIGGANSLNLTLALSKSRFVEFTVKPSAQ